MVDIENNELAVGDEVYYARKANYCANGEMVKCFITHIDEQKQEIRLDKKFTSTRSKTQLLKIKK